jgi:hypothetical protein
LVALSTGNGIDRFAFGLEAASERLLNRGLRGRGIAASV